MPNADDEEVNSRDIWFMNWLMLMLMCHRPPNEQRYNIDIADAPSMTSDVAGSYSYSYGTPYIHIVE